MCLLVWWVRRCVVDENDSPVCEFEAEQSAELHVHVVQHLNWGPDIEFKAELGKMIRENEINHVSTQSHLQPFLQFGPS